MKVNVKDLEANPFREIGKYPIDEAKVTSLERSINDTFFWDNVICRKSGNKYQIAYGHHRLVALQNLKIKKVDIPILDLTDAQMVRIMAEENLEWLTTPLVVYQTVISVKKFLDAELAKYDKWEGSDKFVLSLFSEKGGFQLAKKEGVGRRTILKFLGGNWKSGMIQAALQAHDMERDKKLDMDAVTKFDSIDQARQFQRAVKNFDVPKEKQKEIAVNIKNNLKEKKTVSGHFPQKQITIEDDVSQQVGKKKTPRAKQSEVNRIEKALINIERQSRQLADRLSGLRSDIKKLGIEEMNGLKPALAKFALKRLCKELENWRNQNEIQNSTGRRIVGNVAK
jgi:ParB-like chromosome segregation protein Spo0J